MFYKFHNLQNIIKIGLYDFTDEISLKYNKICNNFDLLDIKLLITDIEKSSAYKIWHSKMTIILFEIPIDSKTCIKCLYFINKFTSTNTHNIHHNPDTPENNYINNMIEMGKATNDTDYNMFLCDLALVASAYPFNAVNIPILDTTNKTNLEYIDRIKKIIRLSYDVKIILTKQDKYKLNTINKILNEDEHNLSYITMSQLLGHYLSHVITNTYIEVDYGYALTVHKSQGSTYDDVYIEYNNLLSNTKSTEKNKLLYTAITRCSNKLHLYY